MTPEVCGTNNWTMVLAIPWYRLMVLGAAEKQKASILRLKCSTQNLFRFCIDADFDETLCLTFFVGPAYSPHPVFRHRGRHPAFHISVAVMPHRLRPRITMTNPSDERTD